MPINYQVKQGDCIHCIIKEHGLLADTVWNFPNNAELKAKRKSIDMLSLGDTVVIPDKRPKEVREPTNQVHKFITKWQPHKHWIEIELIGEDDQPISGEKYLVKLPDGTTKEGILNDQGWARVEGFFTGQCNVTFPELDQDSWKQFESVGPRNTDS